MATDGIETFERFCAGLVIEQGRPMRLEPFQRELLADFFAGAGETVILIPKKNGKTTLLAALALYHLTTTPDAECVIAAASRDQAGIMFTAASGFVRRSPGLRERVQVKGGYREIQSRRDTGRIRVLASDVDTADGVLPTLALVDELHRHRSAGLYGVFRDGLGPRDGRMLTISTAGDSEQSPLGLIRYAAHRLPHVERDGAHLYCRSADEAFVMHEWALQKDDDVDDMRVVKRANPASWQTLAKLARRHDSPSTTSWQWARFACGLWIGVDAWWIDGDAWRANDCADWLEPGDRITVGFDGSRYGDATALIGCRVKDGLLEPLGIWEPPAAAVDAREWQVPGDEVDAAVDDAFRRFDVVRGYFDPPLWHSEIDEWERRYGPAVVQFPTNRTRMMAAVDRFRTDTAAGRLPHAGDPTLTRHVLNARTKEARGGYWLSKAASAEKIDAAIAAVLAYEARCDAVADGLLTKPLVTSW
jgi:phage terminase large subunit-like protein